MDKIIVNLIGGAGNQMFQYALGYTISLLHGQDLYIDLSSYENYKVRNFELNKFGFDIKIANQEDCEILNRKHFFKKILYKDKSKTFNPKLLNIKGSAYLKGFWQSEKYFSCMRDEILSLFEFRDKSFIVNHNLLQDIKNSNAVCVNLRLGDYITNETNKRIHFVCKKDYYTNAIKYMCKNITNPKLFVFSDDIEGSKEFLPDGYDFVFADTANWQEDMYFMSECKHNIVANSSFSWWAAWLNKNPDKIVAAPSRWYTKEARVNDKDVVPNNWVKIKISN